MAGSQGAKFDVVLKLGLVFFVSLLSFAVGTFVGKKFSDNQHKLSKYESGSPEKVADHDAESDSHDAAPSHDPEVATAEHGDAHGEAKDAHGAADAHGAVDAHGKKREVASIPGGAHEVKPKDALSDEEIAKLAQEFVADEKTEKKHDVKHDAKADDKKHSAAGDTHSAKQIVKEHGTKEHAAPAAKTAAHEAPAKPPQKAAPPTELPKELAAAPAGKYTVQIASTQSENDAQKMASGLKDKGHSAFYIPAKIKEKTWYRVSVGLFSTQSEADEFRKRLDKDGISKTIVQKITN